jgi:hypothetical protein
MRAARLHGAVLVLALFAAACSGTTRVGDDLSVSSLGEAKKGVALIKLGAADPLCNVLTAGIGVKDGQTFRLVCNARIERKADETAVAELELDTGEYHVVSYTCSRPGSHVLLAQPAGNGVYKRSYASFALAPGEVVNVGYLQLAHTRTTQIASTKLLHLRIAVTDWPLSELERFKQQRPKLYAQMQTRLMAVHKVEPPTPEQVQAACAEMKRLQADGKLQNLPSVCSPVQGGPGAPLQKPSGPAKKEIRT